MWSLVNRHLTLEIRVSFTCGLSFVQNIIKNCQILRLYWHRTCCIFIDHVWWNLHKIWKATDTPIWRRREGRWSGSKLVKTWRDYFTMKWWVCWVVLLLYAHCQPNLIAGSDPRFSLHRCLQITPNTVFVKLPLLYSGFSFRLTTRLVH